MTVAQRLLSLLLESDSLDTRVQWRVLQEGKKARDTALLVKLLQHPALDPAVDEAIGQLPLAGVRAAWVTRTGRSIEELIDLVSSETRTTVLVAILSTPGLPESVIESAAVRLSARKLLPLLAREDLGMALREKLALMLAEKAAPDTKLTAGDLAGVPTDPSLVRLILDRAVNNALVARCFMLIDATAEDLDLFVSRVVSDLRRAPSGGVRPAEEWMPQVVDALSGYAVSDAQLTQLKDAVTEGYSSRWDCQRVLHGLDQLTSSNVSREAAMRGLKESGSAEEVASVMQTIALHRLPVLPFMRAAYTLPNVTAEGFEAALESAGLSWVDVRLLWATPSDASRTAMLYSRYSWLDFTVADRHLEAPAVVRAVAQRCLEEGKPLPQAVLTSRHLTSDVLASLPVGALMFLDDDTAVKVTGELADVLAEVVCDDSQWGTLRVLADEFEGPLGQLLETSRAL